MKKKQLSIFGLAFIFSISACDDSTIQETPSNPPTTRAFAEDPATLALIEGIPVNLELAQPLGKGKYLGLWYEHDDLMYKSEAKLRADNASTLSMFLISKIVPFPYDLGFNTIPCKIQIVGSFPDPPCSNQTIYFYKRGDYPLTTNSWNQHVVDYYDFYFYKVPGTNDQYYIETFPMYPSAKYIMSLTARGVDHLSSVYFTLADPSLDHLQKWRIVFAESFELIDIVYSISPENIVNQKPDFLTNIIIKNETSLEQSMEATFTEKATISSSFSQNTGVKINISGTISTPKFLGGGAEITVSKETSNSVSYNESETKEDQRSYRFPVRVPPYSIVNAQAAVQQYEANINYTATFKGQMTGKKITIEGRWEGVTAGTITYTLREGSTNRILKTIIGTPKKEIDLTRINK